MREYPRNERMRKKIRKWEREREKVRVRKKRLQGDIIGTQARKKGALLLWHRVWIERRVSIGYFIIAKG